MYFYLLHITVALSHHPFDILLDNLQLFNAMPLSHLYRVYLVSDSLSGSRFTVNIGPYSCANGLCYARRYLRSEAFNQGKCVTPMTDKPPFPVTCAPLTLQAQEHGLPTGSQSSLKHITGPGTVVGNSRQLAGHQSQTDTPILL